MKHCLILLLSMLVLLAACQAVEFRAQGSSQVSVRSGQSLR